MIVNDREGMNLFDHEANHKRYEDEAWKKFLKTGKCEHYLEFSKSVGCARESDSIDRVSFNSVTNEKKPMPEK